MQLAATNDCMAANESHDFIHKYTVVGLSYIEPHNDMHDPNWQVSAELDQDYSPNPKVVCELLLNFD